MKKIKRPAAKAQTQSNIQTIDYQLHLAQNIEVLNQNIELLKNNVYGQTQVDIVLYALSIGKTEDEAVEYSLVVIDKMNALNLKRIEKRRQEIADQMEAARKAQEETAAPVEDQPAA